jgi:hypothetical protein
MEVVAIASHPNRVFMVEIPPICTSANARQKGECTIAFIRLSFCGWRFSTLAEIVLVPARWSAVAAEMHYLKVLAWMRRSNRTVLDTSSNYSYLKVAALMEQPLPC